MTAGNQNGTKPNFPQHISGSETQMGICRQENKDHFNLLGQPYFICSKLQELKNQTGRQPITVAALMIHGDEIKPQNFACLCLTIICGCLLCLPWLCFCCGWWKKIVWPGFGVPLDTYKKLQILLSMKSLKKLSLIVTDNTFDKEKADCLYQMLSRSSVQYFDFVNIASGTNWTGKQYSNFVQNMAQIKSIPSIQSKMVWHHRIVL